MGESDYILKVTNLSVAIQNQVILEHVNFKVKKGTTLAVAGPNGAGKILFLDVCHLLLTGNKWALSKIVMF